ncbi:hypothetical protein CEXT_367051 [Caerostris extrusa]|uniref:Uncharacterized protein n=1 Tax=Caerostris extrusa TaxID=172846 RepID=A0AAV4NK05_CAEEX|nr:hypothetical protein CEXT_367051 [Caerostris extrusa]
MAYNKHNSQFVSQPQDVFLPEKPSDLLLLQDVARAGRHSSWEGDSLRAASGLNGVKGTQRRIDAEIFLSFHPSAIDKCSRG